MTVVDMLMKKGEGLNPAQRSAGISRLAAGEARFPWEDHTIRLVSPEDKRISNIHTELVLFMYLRIFMYKHLHTYM